MKEPHYYDISKELLKRSEGWRSEIYKDIRGNNTIGYGFNLENGISKEVGEAWLEILLREAFMDAAKFFKSETGSPYGFGTLDNVRQAVLVNMAYNLGWNKLNEFVKLRAAVLTGAWSSAANEILDSKAAVLLPSRYHRLAHMMKSGLYEPAK